MKTRTLIAGTIALSLLVTAPLPAADQMTTFTSRSGSKMRIEGTSNIHDWQVESPLIGGMMEVGPNFPTEPGQAATPGKVEAKGEVFIQVRSLIGRAPEGRGKPPPSGGVGGGAPNSPRGPGKGATPGKGGAKGGVFPRGPP